MPKPQHNGPSHPRREFLRQSAGLALVASGLPLITGGTALAANSLTQERKTPETLVKVLFDSLAEKQIEFLSEFDWRVIMQCC